MEKEGNTLNEIKSLESDVSNSGISSQENIQSLEIEVKSVNTTTKGDVADEKLLLESKINSIKADITEKCLKNLQINNNNPLFVNTEDTINHIVTANQGICYTRYKNENQMPPIMHLITKDLSEPYSIYTYRYFIHNWPKLCFLAVHEDEYVGAIVCKLGQHKNSIRRGYIAMLAVNKNLRRRKIGSTLVKLAIESMIEEGCDEVVLETEVTNTASLGLYENLGFTRDKRLYRYYLNGVDALRLKLWLS